MFDSTQDHDPNPEQRLHGAFAAVMSAQVRLLQGIVDCDREETWRPDGCKNYAWLAHRLGTSEWMARRLVNAAHTLPHGRGKP